MCTKNVIECGNISRKYITLFLTNHSLEFHNLTNWKEDFVRLLSNCLIGKLTSLTVHVHLQWQFTYELYELFHIHTMHTSRHFNPDGRYELNKLTLLPMCGFIAQLVEHHTGIAEVMGLNPVEALIFSGFSFSIANWKINRDDHSSLTYSFMSPWQSCICQLNYQEIEVCVVNLLATCTIFRTKESKVLEITANETQVSKTVFSHL